MMYVLEEIYAYLRVYVEFTISGDVVFTNLLVDMPTSHTSSRFV
jgi:hypothetical protein